MERTELTVLEEISGKIDRLTGLFASQGRTQDEQISILHGMGYDWDFVGGVTGLKPGTAKKRFERAKKS